MTPKEEIRGELSRDEEVRGDPLSSNTSYKSVILL
jgi:hypothetical protein